MVSTPIGATIEQKPSVPTPPIPPPQPIYSAIETPVSLPATPNSPGIPIYQPCVSYPTKTVYAPNSQGHTFPVLYSTPPISTSTDIQPVSLYAEYMGNPYNNFITPQAQNDRISPAESNNPPQSNVSESNVFQSSNYFSNVSTQMFIPPGSEILFGDDNAINTNSRSHLADVSVPLISGSEAGNAN